MNVALVGSSAGIYGVDHPFGADSASLGTMEMCQTMMGSKGDGTHERANIREVALTVLNKAPNQSKPFSCDVMRDRVRRTSGGKQKTPMTANAVDKPQSNQYKYRLHMEKKLDDNQ